MARSTLKQMARNAKSRLKNGYSNWNFSSKDGLPSQEKEEKRVYEKALEILSVDEPIVNPLGRLIQDDIFSLLSPEEKEGYILELSRIYLKVTKQILETRDKR